MKIGLVLDTTLDSNAGVQQYFKGLARYLIDAGHDIRFLVPRSKDVGEFAGKIISFGRNIDPIGNVTSVPIAFLLGGKSRIRSILEREKFDIIHVSAPLSPFLGAKIIEVCTCPIVITYVSRAKNILYLAGALLLRLWLWNIYEKIDSFIALSDIARREAEIVIPGNYTVIPSGVDLSNYSKDQKPLEKFDDGKFNILFLGRLEERKGVAYLLRAFKRVQDKVKNARLIIAGDGPLRKSLEKLVGDLKLRNVIFEGFIDEKLKPRYYASAKMCVFPAIWGESFGIVLIESMASGKVTLGFANEGYSFVLKNLPKLLIENKNISKLADAIVKFANDSKLRKEFEARCLEEAARFGWKEIGRKVVNVYENMLDR